MELEHPAVHPEEEQRMHHEEDEKDEEEVEEREKPRQEEERKLGAPTTPPPRAMSPSVEEEEEKDEEQEKEQEEEKKKEEVEVIVGAGRKKRTQRSEATTGRSRKRTKMEGVVAQRQVFLAKEVDPTVRDILRSLAPAPAAVAVPEVTETKVEVPVVTEPLVASLTTEAREATHVVVPDDEGEKKRPLWEVTDDLGVFVAMIQGSCDIVKAGMFFAVVENGGKWEKEIEEKFTLVSKAQAEELKAKAAKNFKNMSVFVSAPIRSKFAEENAAETIISLLESIGAKVVTSMRGASVCLQIVSEEDAGMSNKRYPQVKFQNLKWLFECLVTGSLEKE